MQFTSVHLYVCFRMAGVGGNLILHVLHVRWTDNTSAGEAPVDSFLLRSGLVKMNRVLWLISKNDI